MSESNAQRDSIIFHITERAVWESAQQAGTYYAPSLEIEGFIHLSKAEQVMATANRFYWGQPGLVLLAVECDRLSADLRYETVSNHGTFPHLYGPLNLDAIVAVWPFEPNANGSFTMPANRSK